LDLKLPYLCIVKLINQQNFKVMSYNQIFQREINNGKSEIEASQIARLEMAKQQRQQLKGRTIYDSKNAGAISI
jgi:hypothetical protein